MDENLRSILIGTSGLSVTFAAAAIVVLVRPRPAQDPEALDRTLRLFLLGIAVQCLHVIEEYLTKFHVRLPEFLGLPPWTEEFFVVFNLSWMAIWLVSALGLRQRSKAALVPIWFFAIAMAFNGLVHPVLALQVRGYFPGLVTSPAAGLCGVLLWVRLLRLTRRYPNTR